MNPVVTLLYAPGDRPELMAKALRSDADVVLLDLEDAVAPARKGTARDAVAEALAGVDGADRPVQVRAPLREQVHTDHLLQMPSQGTVLHRLGHVGDALADVVQQPDPRRARPAQAEAAPPQAVVGRAAKPALVQEVQGVVFEGQVHLQVPGVEVHPVGGARVVDHEGIAHPRVAERARRATAIGGLDQKFSAGRLVDG